MRSISPSFRIFCLRVVFRVFLCFPRSPEVGQTENEKSTLALDHLDLRLLDVLLLILFIVISLD